MKFQHLLALNLIALSSATSSGYNYGAGHHNSQAHRHTDFVHSDKHAGYSQPEHFADIQTVKVLHQQAQPSTGKHNDYYADRPAPSAQNYYVSSNSIGDYNAAGNGYSSPYIGLSSGYTTGLSNYATEKEHVRVIRVIHEFGPISSRSQSYGSGGKSKGAKTIKILHEYPRNSYSDASSKFVKPASYVPYDHHNAYNSDTNEGAFQDSYETLKSLKAIGIFSKPEYLSAPRDTFPPTNMAAGVGVGGWLKKK